MPKLSEINKRMDLDYLLFKIINNLAGKYGFLDKIGIFCAQLLILILPLAILIIYYFHSKKVKAKLMILTGAGSVCLAMFINYFISLFYFRPRPFVSYQVNQLIEKSSLDKSFPSDHAALSFALAFSIYFFNKKLGIIAFIIALLVSLARIFCGLHYPLDILAGLMVGFLSAFISQIIAKKVLNKSDEQTSRPIN